jgi:hypothetical protein
MILFPKIKKNKKIIIKKKIEKLLLVLSKKFVPLTACELFKPIKLSQIFPKQIAKLEPGTRQLI